MAIPTKEEIYLPAGAGIVADFNSGKYSRIVITPERAEETRKLNNIPENILSTATTSGGWVFINPNYPDAEALLAAYSSGTFTGDYDEIAPGGVWLRLLPDKGIGQNFYPPQSFTPAQEIPQPVVDVTPVPPTITQTVFQSFRTNNELNDMIEAHLNAKFIPQAQRGREDATAKKGNRVFAEDVGTPIYEYLDGPYWRRIVAYVESQVAPVRALAQQALAAAQSAAAAAAGAAELAQSALSRAMTPGPPGPPGPAGATGAAGAAGHTDTYTRPHTDTPHNDTTHTDAPHTDTPHTDNIPHTDTPHTDTPHTDAPHTDTPHSDIQHVDTEIIPHNDTYISTHGDTGGGGGGGGGGGTEQTFF